MIPVSRYFALLITALSISATTAGSYSSCQTSLGGSYPTAIATYPSLKDAIELIARQQVAQWYTDRVADVPSLAKAVVLPVCSDANQGSTPPTIVVYGLPQKDCAHGFSTAGSNANNADYRTFLQQLADAAGNQQVVYILEPDAIGLLADGGCGNTKGYAENLGVAMDILSQNSNAEIYLDVGYWTLGDDDQAAAVAKIVNAVDPNCKCKGISLNTSNYRSNAEMTATCERFVKASGREYKCIVDTSRNFVSPPSTEWCNANWAGIGELPTTNTGSEHVSRFVWVKPPGESDGECTGQSDRSLRGPDASVFFPEHFVQLWNNGVFVQKLGMTPISAAANSTSNATTSQTEMPTSAPTNLTPTTLTPTTLTPTPGPATVAPTTMAPTTMAPTPEPTTMTPPSPAPTTTAPSTEQFNTQEIKITSLDLLDDTPGQVNVGGWYSEDDEDATEIPATVPTTPTPTTSSPAVVEAEPPHTMVVIDDAPEEYAVNEDADFTRVDDQTDDDIVVGSIRTRKACE